MVQGASWSVSAGYQKLRIVWRALLVAALAGILVVPHIPIQAQSVPMVSVACVDRVAAVANDAVELGSAECTFSVSPPQRSGLTIRYKVGASGNRTLNYEQRFVSTAASEQELIYYLPETTAISVRLLADTGYTVGSVSKATIAVGTAGANSGAGLHLNESGALDGYMLLTGTSHSRFYLVDNEGREAYRWDTPGGFGELLNNGNLITGSTNQGINEISPSGDAVYEYATTDQHHDVIKLSNGNYLLINSEYHTRDESIAAGADPDCLGPNGLEVDQIVEIKPSDTSGGEVVWKWSVWDHLIQDHDPTKDNYGVVGDHPELIDINYGVCQIREHARNQWLKDPAHLTHLNSIDYNTSLEQILITSRHFSEVWVVDHSTSTAQAAASAGGNSGMGGNLLYRFGNPRAHHGGNKGDQQLFFPHAAHWIPSGLQGAGNILVYNNGHEHPGFVRPYASVDELAFPAAGYTYLRAGNGFMLPTLVWTHRLAEPTWILSNAQRLPNGNTLIIEGEQARISEVAPDGKLMWHYISPLSKGTQVLAEGASPDKPRDAYVYRAYKYASDHPGILALTLTPVAERQMLTSIRTSTEVEDSNDLTQPKLSEYVVPAALIADVRLYAAEVDNGSAHVERWNRVLLAFGEDVEGFTGTPMTATEAQTYANRGWSRWDPVTAALEALEAQQSDEEDENQEVSVDPPTPTPTSTPTPTPTTTSAVDRPVVTLEQTRATVTEGDNTFLGFSYYYAYISIDKPVNHPVSVYFSYQTTGSGLGHATDNDDFATLSYRLTILPGLTRNRITVLIMDDNDQESDETLRLLISDPQGATINNSQTILTIQDND